MAELSGQIAYLGDHATTELDCEPEVQFSVRLLFQVTAVWNCVAWTDLYVQI